jgi:DnaJ-class molecular chaperone
MKHPDPEYIPVTPENVQRIIDDELQSMPQEICGRCGGDGRVTRLDIDEDMLGDTIEFETCPSCFGEGLK